ncbi:uncharacterized protein LOC131598487 [Vicia villosa]|uniref:uncharacterized protein LOC131598487 n=1 Tax=Vicia villosa TaxID=3911 RepID=UPI00273C2329|nr:uncharacterized protein LOC131598487 [Vicia villosa]
MPPSIDAGSDIRIDVGQDGDHFNVGVMYRLLDDCEDNTSIVSWKYIWKIQATKQVRCSVWILHRDILLTNSRKHIMGLGSAMCSFCNNIEEDTNKQFNFFASNLKDWISSNMNCNLWWNADKDWMTFWATAYHSIWTWHNRETRDGSLNRPLCMITHINNLVQDYEHVKTAANINLCLIELPHRVLRFMKWEASMVGWVKLNTNEARDNHRNTTCGGIIRGSKREWVGGFSKYIGISSVYITKL